MWHEQAVAGLMLRTYLTKRKANVNTKSLNHFSKFMIFVFSLLGLNTANAVILYSIDNDIDAISDSQTNTYDSTGLENYENIALSVKAIGDYGDTQPDEYITLSLDSFDLGTYTKSTTGVAATALGSESSIDWQLEFEVAINQSDWLTAISDGFVTFLWENGPGVGNFSSFNNGGVVYDDRISIQVTGDFVDGSESPVPEPSILALMCFGLVGFAAVRRQHYL